MLRKSYSCASIGRVYMRTRGEMCMPKCIRPKPEDKNDPHRPQNPNLNISGILYNMFCPWHWDWIAMDDCETYMFSWLPSTGSLFLDERRSSSCTIYWWGCCECINFPTWLAIINNSNLFFYEQQQFTIRIHSTW